MLKERAREKLRSVKYKYIYILNKGYIYYISIRQV